jgi:hypothetical protein
VCNAAAASVTVLLVVNLISIIIFLSDAIWVKKSGVAMG